MQQEKVEFADAELVFVGYGIQAPEYDWDDYKGVDLTGKVLAHDEQRPVLGSGAVRAAKRAFGMAAGTTSTSAPHSRAR